MEEYPFGSGPPIVLLRLISLLIPLLIIGSDRKTSNHDARNSGRLEKFPKNIQQKL